MSPSKSHGNDSKPSRTGRWILGGLLLGVLCGLLLGEYCEDLQVVGQAYVGLLQMTVLPYLVISLIAKMGRLDVAQAKKLGFTALAVWKFRGGLRKLAMQKLLEFRGLLQLTDAPPIATRGNQTSSRCACVHGLRFARSSGCNGKLCLHCSACSKIVGRRRVSAERKGETAHRVDAQR